MRMENVWPEQKTGAKYLTIVTTIQNATWEVLHGLKYGQKINVDMTTK